MAARITKYLNKYVRRGICLIYMSSFYFWSPQFARKNTKNQYAVWFFTSDLLHRSYDMIYGE
jgi:putative SOS response-associated peptidase YedK